MTTFALTFVPVMREDGYRWMGAPEVVAVGRYADVARAWRREVSARRVMHAADPRRFALVGKAAESGRFGLHVIGQGTLTIAEVSA